MLSEIHLKTLQALVNRIIPPDEYPGGWEAGVGDYLLRQFERDLKDVLPQYLSGLEALEAEALAVTGKPFTALAAEQQDAILGQLEQGQVQTPWPLDPAAFFRMACQHCAEGFYSDPGNGGNRNEIAWKMIGFEVRG